MTVPAELIEATVRHQVFLERLKSGEVAKFAPFLQEIDRLVRLRLSGTNLTEFQRGRAERLVDRIGTQLAAIYARFSDELQGDLFDLAEYESGFEARALNRSAPGVDFDMPSDRQLRAAVLAAPLSVRGSDGGKLLAPFIADWSAREVQAVTGAIRRGVFEGQTNAEIVQAVRGTRANRFTDGLLAVSSRHARAVVSTAVQHVSSVARQETWDANADIVKGVRWVSTLDGRTTIQCQSLDGQVFDRDKGPRPPIHINCRSTTVAELNDEFAFLSEGATRASQDGPVPSGETYYEWLQQQPAAFQDEALGPVRAQLLRDGGLSADRFAELQLGRDFQPLTLFGRTLPDGRRELGMIDLEPLAFARAGLKP